MSETERILLDLPREGYFGLEQEGLRVDARGRMAQTPNPFLDDPHIDRDFCENQVEFGTDVYSSIEDLADAVAFLRAKIAKTLLHLPTGPEYIWPFSTPPAIADEDEIPIARFEDPAHPMLIYRQYLAEKYGKWVMAYSGTHFNFSFPEHFLRTYFKVKAGRDFRSFVDALYMEIAESLVEVTWLLVYLTAASPEIDPSNRACPPGRLLDFASPRCSEIGYWNPFVPVLDFSSVASYAASITRYIDEGLLYAGSELYYPIRVKSRGKYNFRTLIEQGIDHIELRMLDLNPLSPLGVEPRDLSFIYYLILYLGARGRTHHLSPDEQRAAIANMKSAARYDDGSVTILAGGVPVPIRHAARRFLSGMARAFRHDPAALRVIAFEERKARDPSARYAVRVRETYHDNYIPKGLSLARARATAPYTPTCASYSLPFRNKNAC